MSAIFLEIMTKIILIGQTIKNGSLLLRIILNFIIVYFWPGIVV